MVESSNTIGLMKTLNILLLIAGVGFLSSCNIPTLEQDAKHVARKAKNVALDTYDAVEEKVEQTFDPETNDLFDRYAGLSKDDYKELLAHPAPIIEDNPPDPILPDVSQLLVTPQPPMLGRNKLVTLSVTEDIPLKEVLIELARRADVDIEVDPGISGGIIFRAKDKPFSEVMERIAELTGLRYSIKNGVLKIERDLAYINNYQMDVLNLTRTATSNVSVNTKVLTATEGGGEAFNTGSDINLESAFNSDIWSEINIGVTQILAAYSGNKGLFGGNGAAAGDVLGQGANSGRGNGDSSAILSVNKQSGVISVLANEKQHREIKKYLDKVKTSQSAQVLIEAKVVEVNLADSYRSGIAWDLFSRGKLNFRASGNFPTVNPLEDGQNLAITALPQELFGIDDLSLETVVSFIEEFGAVRTLSNPRVNATNNQQAVLTFAKNVVYFDVELEEEQIGTGDTAETRLRATSDQKTVPEGVILTLQPNIDLKNSEIVMSIRPTLSRVSEFILDPSVSLIAERFGSSITSPVPVMEVREIDSILRIKSGQVMVIGGLIEERSDNKDTGVPFAKDIPYVGNLFKTVEKNTSIVETVIFIKATIIPSHGVSREDKEFYRKYGSDRRPLTF